MRKATYQNGITLIALIITIIVMLILVGVTINVALNGGLFHVAREAAKETQIAADKEQLQGQVLAVYNAQTGEIDNIALKESLEAMDWTVNSDGNPFICSSPKENTFKVTVENGNIKIEYQEEGATTGGNEATNDFEIEVTQANNDFSIDPVTLNIRPIIPDSWNNPEFTEEEAVVIVAEEMLERNDITTLKQLDLEVYNAYTTIESEGNPIFGAPTATDFEDMLAKFSTVIGTDYTDATEQEFFAMVLSLMGAPFTTVEEFAADSYQYEPSSIALKICEGTNELTDITDEASWSGYNATYTVTKNGTYTIQLELDGKVGRKTIEISNILEHVGKYVKYDADQDGSVDDEILYRVLYEEGELGEGQGAQIISNDVLQAESVHLGYNDDTIPEGAVTDELNGDSDLNFEKALYSYNHAVETLNNKCAALPEAKQVAGITIRVRSVGSDPLNAEDTEGWLYKTSIDGYYGTWFDKYDGLAKVDSSNYSDSNRLTKCDLKSTTDNHVYWIARRHLFAFWEFCNLRSFNIWGAGIGRCIHFV